MNGREIDLGHWKAFKIIFGQCIFRYLFVQQETVRQKDIGESNELNFGQLSHRSPNTPGGLASAQKDQTLAKHAGQWQGFWIRLNARVSANTWMSLEMTSSNKVPWMKLHNRMFM